MSAHRDVQEASALGVQGIHWKPFDLLVLLDTVERLLLLPPYTTTSRSP
jgi:hypothetical protein